MSKLEREFQNESKARLKKLEDEFEEFQCNISEKNLRLKTPYTTDRNGNGLNFSVPDVSTKIMYVYLGDEPVGQIELE